MYIYYIYVGLTCETARGATAPVPLESDEDIGGGHTEATGLDLNTILPSPILYSV